MGANPYLVLWLKLCSKENILKLSKIKILGKLYTIFYPKTQVEVNTTGNEPLFGEISYVKEEIRIFGGLSEFDRFHVLLHEVIHGISKMLELRLNERAIDLLALGIANVLIDNKLISLEK